MSDAKIADRDEVLKLLTEKARDGSTSAMIALERALRAADRQDHDDLDREFELLTKGRK